MTCPRSSSKISESESSDFKFSALSDKLMLPNRKQVQHFTGGGGVCVTYKDYSLLTSAAPTLGQYRRLV